VAWSVSFTLLLAALVAAGGARAFPDHDERDRFLDPPPSLPESVNGTVRATRDGAQAGRIERIRDVFPAIRSCWRLPKGAGLSGQQLTVRLSFKRSGELLGRPRITYAALSGDAEAQRRFAASVLAAFETCLPLPFSPALGAAIAGRPFTFRFVDDRRA
jgi:hypothetical protein